MNICTFAYEIWLKQLNNYYYKFITISTKFLWKRAKN